MQVWIKLTLNYPLVLAVVGNDPRLRGTAKKYRERVRRGSATSAFNWRKYTPRSRLHLSTASTRVVDARSEERGTDGKWKINKVEHASSRLSSLSCIHNLRIKRPITLLHSTRLLAAIFCALFSLLLLCCVHCVARRNVIINYNELREEWELRWGLRRCTKVELQHSSSMKMLGWARGEAKVKLIFIFLCCPKWRLIATGSGPENVLRWIAFPMLL